MIHLGMAEKLMTGTFKVLHVLVDMSENRYTLLKLGNNCIQTFHLEWYIVEYTVENFVYGDALGELLNMISDRIYDNI